MADFDVTMKWEGVDQVLERMQKLSLRMQTSIPRKAARRGMNLVRDAARARAQRIDDVSTVPPLGSTIYRNIIVQESRRGKQLGGILMRVGVRGGSRTRPGQWRGPTGVGGTTPHWRHVEFGAQGKKARPFMRPALQENQGAVADTVAEVLREELDKAGV